MSIFSPVRNGSRAEHCSKACYLCYPFFDNTEFKASAMADCWDPAQLLQIEGYNSDAQIQCIGRAARKHGTRCRWTCGDDDDLLRIYDIMDSMARRRPWEVTRQDLTRLARLCLCREYH